MVLRSLRFHGFKSFADPVDINFPGRVTGIIGPNGCGKSNIVDAVRFVLGEQSLRLLRARKIDDLIFAGNIRRPATSIAEVALVLDNATRWLDIDYPEVEIRRMIQRDGESKYFLNGTAVRLKDIQKMFMDVGVNKGHYSVIGQGQVQMIVGASPEERRLYFEEAAGIVSYRQSKKETMRRLDEVQKNLEQAAVFASEYESRMHGLKVQAGRAQKYLEYQTEYRQLYLFSAFRRYLAIRDEMESFAQNAEAKKAELAALEQSSSDASVGESALAQDRARVADEVSESEAAVRAAANARAEKDKTLAAIEEKLYSLKRGMNDIDFARLKLARAIAEFENADAAAVAGELNAWIDRLKKELAVSIERAEFELERIRAELASTETRLREEETRLDSSHADLISAHEAAAALESTLAALHVSVDEIRARIETLTAQVSADHANRSALQEEQEAHLRRRSDCGLAQTSAEVAVKEAEERMDQSRRRLNELRSEMAEVEGRYRSLHAAEESHQGFSSSVRMVLDRFGKRDEFLGVVRDLLSFDPAYAKAVEAALGPKLQHLVVATGDTVKDILRELGGDLRGRVTFWALDLLPPPVAAPALAMEDNRIGWAVSLLKFDEKLRRLFENLLGRTLVVKDMEALLSSAKTARGFSIVTLDGSYYRSGAITAGPTAGAMLMSRKQEFADTESKLKDLVDRIAAEEQVHNRACSEVAAARAAQEAAYRRYKDADADHARVSASLDSLTRISEERRQQLEIESNRLSQKLEAISEAQSRHVEIREGGTGSPVSQAGRQILEDLRRQVQTLRAESESASDQLRSLKERERDILRIEAEHLEIQSRLQTLQTEIQSTEDQIVRTRQELAEAQAALDSSTETLKSRQAESARIASAIDEIRTRAAAFLHQIQNLRDEIHQLELRLTALVAERGNIRENVLNELQTDIESVTEPPALPAGCESVAPEEYGTHLKDLQSKMQKLGTVNVNAIEEFNEVSAKHEELAKQLADLTLARENLKEVLRKTDRVCRERFREVFERVAGYFQEVTKKLFQGGEGKLILTESEDMMESGVDIQLRPPGKGFTSIASRSGGEQSMAGLCLLFALFMEKPSPFCMLDEVDAALDDVNVGRLVRLIEEFSEKIQFVIVTHNKLSMQAASCLFGATMEEAGITKLISVRMKNAQEATLAAAS